MTPKFKLYHYWRSTSSWRVRWALSYKQIPYETQAINLLSDETEAPEYLAINSMGYVPSLTSADINFKSGSLTQSVAILEWLEEKFPESPLLPKNLEERAFVRSLVNLIACDTHPLQNLSAQERHSSDPMERKKWAQDWNLKGLTAYSKLIQNYEKSTGKKSKYSLGDQLTLADLCLIPQIYNAKRFELDLSTLTRILEIEAHCSTLESYIASHPDRFKPQF